MSLTLSCSRDKEPQTHPHWIGKVWIGTISLMPNDNIEGFRADVLKLLKGLRSPVYRWAGGNFVSGYNWHKELGSGIPAHRGKILPGLVCNTMTWGFTSS